MTLIVMGKSSIFKSVRSNDRGWGGGGGHTFKLKNSREEVLAYK